LRDVAASVVRPVKELKDFRKVMLQPGEEKQVQFSIDRKALSFYNAKLEYVAEPGEFQVQIGLDSKEVKTASFNLQ
ncbi:fibronectin type III-like domain-contianing protein, partial [Herbaspirillum seropedicae]